MIIDDAHFNQMIDFLCTDLPNQYDCIIGLKRGGLVPAVHLSHRLNIPMYVADVTHELSKGDNLSWHDGLLPSIPEGQKILIVDDIIDSGYTLAVCAEYYKNTNDVDIGVLVAKTSAIQICEHHVKNVVAAVIISDDAPFVYFPWEVKPGV